MMSKLARVPSVKPSSLGPRFAVREICAVWIYFHLLWKNLLLLSDHVLLDKRNWWTELRNSDNSHSVSDREHVDCGQCCKRQLQFKVWILSNFSAPNSLKVLSVLIKKYLVKKYITQYLLHWWKYHYRIYWCNQCWIFQICQCEWEYLFRIFAKANIGNIRFGESGK